VGAISRALFEYVQCCKVLLASEIKLSNSRTNSGIAMFDSLVPNVLLLFGDNT
jgi:hypothetical protein